MAVHKIRVIDQTGDTATLFDLTKEEEVARAKAIFDQLKSEGFVALAPERPGTEAILHDFDKEVEETVILPQILGG